MKPFRLVLAAFVVAALAPARADAAAILAAYDRYEPGQGFQISLANVTTGAAIAVPDGVNTAADELHPAISTNGRFIWFVRTRLAPGLSGDVVPPEARELWRADRISGEVTKVIEGTQLGYGVSFNAFGSSALTYGFRPQQNPSSQFDYAASRGVDPATGDFNAGAVSLVAPEFITTGFIVETTHVTRDFPANGPARYYVAASAFDGNGVRVQTAFRGQTLGGGPSVSLQSNANHPVPRPGDRHVAFQQGFGTAADIKSFNFPTLPALTAAEPISTANTYEGMPAWSPDNGKYLGFVRVVGGRRQLFAFDTTPGIQDALNPPIDMGPEAPTAGLRSYQETFGSLAFGSLLIQSVPSFTTCSACVQTTADRVKLTPGLTAKSAVGIFVARVKGTRTLLGRRVPEVEPVGRVPLGGASKGRTTFEWDGSVGGKRLPKGSYLLTFRALKGERITATSGSVRFRVTAGGELKGIEPLK